MKAKLIIGSLLFLFFVGFAEAVPDGGVAYYNFNDNVEDQWNSYDGGVTGMTYSTDYPAYNSSGAGGNASGMFYTGDWVDTNLPFSDLSSQSFTISAWVKTNTTENDVMAIVSDYDSTSGNYERIHLSINQSGYLRLDLMTNSVPIISAITGTTHLRNNSWFHVLAVRDQGGNDSIYVNGQLEATTTDNGATFSFTGYTDFSIGALRSQNSGADGWEFNGSIDEVKIWNRVLNETEILTLYNYGNVLGESSINMTNINCTSCNVPDGDTTEPYTTYDTTPTFSFYTNFETYCRIGDENLTYDNMGNTRNCSTGDGTQNHICTLNVEDELIFATDYVYIVCDNPNYNESSVELQMEITGLSNNATAAIQQGIEDSIIWPGATIYTNQQVYLRDVNNNQVLATVDKVAVYGNQRWIFNYATENETRPGLFNISPVIYVLDMQNVSLTDIKDSVTSLIDSTKN